MSGMTPEDITAAAVASFADTPDPRLRHIMQALTRHLHAFVAEVRPTDAEWLDAIGFLTRVGHTCQGARQEFILLSDVLGLSMLVDALQHEQAQQARGDDDAEAATQSTVLGPFYVDGPPTAEQGADIAAGAAGRPLLIDVQVVDRGGAPVPGAQVDIWQCDEEGLYDIQREGGGMALRARIAADGEGRVRCRSVVPVPYRIPSDGPVGDLLAATGRHGWRPAHVHFRIAAPGFATLVTHLFAAGDPYLGSDAVFGVKPSLVCKLGQVGGGENPLDETVQSINYVFVLGQGAGREQKEQR